MMKLSEYVQYDGTGLAELIRNKQVNSEELLNCAMQAIEQVNPSVNAVISVVPEQLRGDNNANGPFAGVPFLIKDLVLQMQGVESEACSGLMQGTIAEHDSDLMTRYRKAGLVTIGRTATPEFGYNATTEPKLHGPTRNPWDINKMAGGSSGGAAAAVAAGIVPMAHASDGGGSIRVPASCCGLVGLKPTRGRTPQGPDHGEVLSGLGIEHAVTRSVRDSAALLDATEGPGCGDHFQIQRPVSSYLQEVATDPGSLKIAWTVDPWKDSPVDADVISTIEDSARLLDTLGHKVTIDRPEFDTESFWGATRDIWAAGLAAWVQAASQAHGRAISNETVERSILACYEYGQAMSVTNYITAGAVMNQVCRNVAPFFEQYDILMTPTVGRVPQSLAYLDADREGWTAESWTQHLFDYCPFTPLFNATGQPAISLPLGWSSDGLPIGVQFVAAYGKEYLLYRLAGQLEAARPWINKRPPVFAA